MTTQQKREIREKLRGREVSIAADGLVSVKQSYFYRMGRSEVSLANEIVNAIPQAKIVGREDRYANWPKTSYFVVKFRLE